MKKIKNLIKVFGVMLVFVLLTGCSGNTSTTNYADVIPKTFTSGAHLQYKDLECYAQINAENAEGLDIVFASPESLKDIKITLIDNKINLNYKDLDFTIDNESKMGNAVSSMILKALNAALEDKEVTVGLNGSAIVIEGKIESANFILSIDSKTGNFLKLEIPAQDFVMEFSNFTIKR